MYPATHALSIHGPNLPTVWISRANDPPSKTGMRKPKGRLIGYVRVFTDEQATEAPIDGAPLGRLRCRRPGTRVRCLARPSRPLEAASRDQRRRHACRCAARLPRTLRQPSPRSGRGSDYEERALWVPASSTQHGDVAGSSAPWHSSSALPSPNEPKQALRPRKRGAVCPVTHRTRKNLIDRALRSRLISSALVTADFLRNQVAFALNRNENCDTKKAKSVCFSAF
ncbi:hypothetical protein ABID20_003742 [Rhizobium alvei]